MCVTGPVVEVVQGYKFALDPTPSQAEALASHCGAARFAFNTMLAVVKANLDQRTAERTYGIGNEDLTPSVNWSAFGLQREWNLRKDSVAPWWVENSKHAYQSGCKHLARALSNWSKTKTGAYAGTRGFPRFKSRHSTAPSCSFSDGVYLTADRRHVVLPRIGSVRLHHSTRRLARRIEAGTARITGTTISFRRGRWMVAFTVRVDRTLGRPAHVAPAPVRDRVIGVDLGVRHLLVVATPDGREIARVPAPRALTKAQVELRMWQRKAARQHGPYDPATKRRREPSAGWRKTQTRIARLHHRAANLRETALHTATANLAKRYDVIGVETLAPANMGRRGGARKRGLNRSLADASFGEVARQLDYKSHWYGATLVRADRFYPSTKTCSTCGTVKAKLPLHQRTYQCDNPACGLVIDRDLNAAINLAQHAATASRIEAAPSAGSGPVAGLVTGGATQKTPHPGAAGDEAGTRELALASNGSAVRKERLVPTR